MQILTSSYQLYFFYLNRMEPESLNATSKEFRFQNVLDAAAFLRLTSDHRSTGPPQEMQMQILTSSYQLYFFYLNRMEPESLNVIKTLLKYNNGNFKKRRHLVFQR